MDHTATVAATVLQDAAGTWVLLLESSTTEVVETVPTGWDGAGRFHDEGLNHVGVLLRERGLVYTGPWTGDAGVYTVVLHGQAPWGPQWTRVVDDDRQASRDAERDPQLHEIERWAPPESRLAQACQRYRPPMTKPTARLAVGWCHGCGTLQLRDEMPSEWLEWTEAVEPVCVNDADEPWGVGVWDMGEHDTACPSVARARSREVDWSPVLEECTCGGRRR